MAQKDRPVETEQQFMFATGIENSYPVVSGRNGRTIRRDELESTRFYERRREDFSLLREGGVKYLRYRPQYYRVSTGDGRYDWAFTDETFNALNEAGIIPIGDLCQFGVPDWIGDFQNPDWPELFARYAREFARRFPWVALFTPVNEIFVNATFSAKNGWWNERLKSDRAFVTARKNMCKANIRAEEKILTVQPNAIFIQSEAKAFYHEREYHWFMDHGVAMCPHCIMDPCVRTTRGKQCPSKSPQSQQRNTQNEKHPHALLSPLRIRMKSTVPSRAYTSLPSRPSPIWAGCTVS